MVDGRGELAGSEGVEGAETGVELGGGQGTLAVEPAEKIGGRALAFERIAFEVGNQVAIGVAPPWRGARRGRGKREMQVACCEYSNLRNRQL